MASSHSALLRLLAAVLCLGLLLSPAAPSAAAPPAQDTTPTPEATAEGTAGATDGTTTPEPTEGPPSSTATLTAVEAGDFPDLRAYMLVNDVNGARIGALPASAFSLAENGVPVRGLSVRETDVGVQVVFVIDANDAFSARDANGINRLEYVRQAINAFVTGEPRLKPGIDIVTVLAAEGPLVERTDNPALITRALDNYTTGFGGAADPFPLLNRALGYAEEVTPRPAMRRYVVYFSNGWNQFDIEAGLVDVGSRAIANGIPIYPVFVGPIGADNTLGSQNLLRLAQATGGERIIFNGPEALAPLLQRLSDLGRQYELSYRSTLAETGQHHLAAQVALPGEPPLASNDLLFPLRVEAPMLSLTGVPASVERVAAGPEADLALAEPSVLPVGLSLDFPDGNPRGVRLAQLLVDGQVVVTQTNPLTLDTLAWPLAAYTEAGEHQLQARIIDELGLAAESELVPVALNVRVPAAPANDPTVPVAGETQWPLLWVALSTLGLALAIGLGAWWWLARRQRLAEALAAAEAMDEDTVAVRPVRREAAEAAPRAAGRLGLPHVSLPQVAVPSFRWNARPVLSQPKGLFYFEVVEPGGGGAPRADIDVAAPIVNLGRDAAVADTVFHDRSVSRLHARVLLKDERVRIVDQGSTSGTWVNYTPVQGEAGCELQHGDLVNLGRVQLRFLRRDAPPANGNGARVTPAAAAVLAPAPGDPDAGAPDKAGP